MKKLFLIPILTLLLLPGLITTAVAQKKGQEVNSQTVQMLFQNPKINNHDSVLKDFVNGEQKTRVIVTLSKPANANQLNNLKSTGVRKQLKQSVKEAQNRIIPGLDTQKIRITKKFSYIFGFSAEVTLDGLTDLIDHPNILSIEEDGKRYLSTAQGIPLMNATTVRNTYNGAGISVAIVDSGIDYNHTSLGGGGFPNTKVIGGYDTGDNDADPMDEQGHGTACAGIVAGDLGNNGDYIGGVAYGAKLYALKVMDAAGDIYDSYIIDAWEWCITNQYEDPANPIMIISNSFGGGMFESTCDDDDRISTAYPPAIANAVSAGMTFFVASGNDGYCNAIAAPACLSQAISVGAVYDASLGQNPPDPYVGCISDFSCVGTPGLCDEKYYVDSPANADQVTTYSNSADFLELFAPSEWATTTKWGGGYWGVANGFGGTSAATPYAAGAAAVLQSANMAENGAFLTPAQVKLRLVEYGDLVTDPKAGITKPRINLAASVDEIAPPRPLIVLEDYNLSIWDISGTYDCNDGDVACLFLSQDSKGKITGSGSISSYSLNATLEIKGKITSRENLAQLKLTIKGTGFYLGSQYKSTEKLTMGINKNDLSFVGTSKLKECAKGLGCDKNQYNFFMNLPGGMTGNGRIIIDAEPDLTGKKFEGTGGLILSNQDEYPLSFKGKYKSKTGETKYALKGENGIKFNIIKNETSGSATSIKAKALGQKLKY